MAYKLLVFLIFIASISITNQHVTNGYIRMKTRRVFKPKITTHTLNKSIHFAKDAVDRLSRLEKSLDWSDIKVRPHTADHAYFLENSPNSRASEQGKYAYITAQATTQLKHKYCRRLMLSEKDCLRFLEAHNLRGTKLSSSCAGKKNYFPDYIFADYRSIDGTSNHPYGFSLGESETSYKRLAPPIYLDGIQRVKNSVTKSKLPSPRTISSILFDNDDKIDDKRTLNLLAWTEFIAHDVAHTVTRKMIHSHDKITCCGESGANLSPRYAHPFCLPIEIPENDEFYSKFDVRCMSYVRSLPSITNDCSFGALEQLNQATHYLDGSQIYGSDRKTSENLRSFKNGLLKHQIINNEVFLPYSTNEEDCLHFGRQKCFKGGDPRLNSQPLLTTLHTLFLREHNRIAEILGEINPHWDDDVLYEESRRVVVAELQHITYDEWMPLILGGTIRDPPLTDFDMFNDPRVSNSFATAVTSFSTSLFDGNIKLYDENRDVNVTWRLRDVYHKPSIIERAFDKFLITLSTQNSQKVDLNVPDDVRNHLFGNGRYGLDAVSLDIQRGRDHGLPGYVTFRKLCGLGKVKRFDDLSPLIPEEIVDVLSQLYRDPKDIDLLVGGLSETALNGGILGPTFSCMLTDQFLRTKHADRYFYSHSEQPKPFTSEQLEEIQSVTLSSIFCANGNVKELQRNVFKTIDDGNYLQDCAEIPQINFEHWRERN